MSLESLIQSRINLTAEEIQAELNAKTVRKTNSVRFTWTGLLEKFGEEACNSINEKIGDGPVSKALSGIGIDFSLDKTQDGLEAKRSFLGDTVVDSLKSLGVYYITPYQQEGYVGEVTLEEVISVRQSILDREQKIHYNVN